MKAEWRARATINDYFTCFYFVFSSAVISVLRMNSRDPTIQGLKKSLRSGWKVRTFVSTTNCAIIQSFPKIVLRNADRPRLVASQGKKHLPQLDTTEMVKKVIQIEIHFHSHEVRTRNFGHTFLAISVVCPSPKPKF